MTTIAVSTGNREHPASMACDLQMTYGNNLKMKTASKILEVVGENAQKLFSCNRAFIGFSGSTSAWANAVAWFTIPEGSPPRVGNNLEMLLLTDNKEIMHSTNLVSWTAIKEKYFAIGSGCAHAVTALECGKTPKEAVLLASKRDIYSGMGVKEFVL